MDNPYKNKNRIYGGIFVIVLVLLVFMISRKNSDEKWFDRELRIAVLPLEGEINSSRKWISELKDFANVCILISSIPLSLETTSVN